jgi:putative secretion ATPase (PEP-CTERM system associated)
MYEAFFNLRIKPFDLLPDPRFIYLSKSHKKALTYLDYGIRERSGFILLTGEVGSGKTTLIRDLLDKRYEHVVLSKIFNTRVTSEQLLAMINDDFGLAVQGKDKVTLIRDLNSFLIEQYAAGNQPILIIDEAQNLSPELLEEVRMLSNLESANSKLLQIILVGQPELRTILAAPELRQLRQRININCHLHALNRVEMELYIARRLEVAGNASAVTFIPASMDAVYRYSRGIPRLINIICDFLMLSAFADQSTAITVEMVQDVIGDLDFENYYWTADTDEQSTDEQCSGEQRTDEQRTDGQRTEERPRLQDADARRPAPELQGIISEISRRMESLEQNIAAPLHTAFKEQNERFGSLQETVSSHVTKTNSHIQDLSKKIEEIRNSVQSNEQVAPQAPQEAVKKGFFQRIWGGNSSPQRKR